jgi:thiosulfate/3-mercaptopyruvate sulfurtransferase
MLRKLAIAVAAILAVTPAAAADAWQKLVDPADLAALAQEDGVTVLDIRGAREYATAHVPGAINMPYPAWRGPAENPGEPLTDERLTEVMRAAGLEPGERVVVTHAGIDRTDFGAAARVYWTLKSAGLEEIAILNGGVRGWIAEGRPLSVEPTKPEPSKASFALSEEWMATRRDVAATVAGERPATLLDARTEAFYAGEKKHKAAEKPGTAPGARNLVHETWFGDDATRISPAERVAALADASDVPRGEVVSFCNTGHWAATNWFALSELAGREDVKLYPESMVGWGNSGGTLVEGGSAD